MSTTIERDRLKSRRMAELFSFSHEGVSYTASFGRNEEGGIRELFLDAGKEGSTANTVARETAVILSISLQFGTPLSVIRDALPKLADGTPAGPVGMALGFVSEPVTGEAA